MAIAVFYKKNYNKYIQDTGKIIVSDVDFFHPHIDKIIDIARGFTHTWIVDSHDEANKCKVYELRGLNISVEQYQFIKTRLMDYNVYCELEN